MAAVELPVYCRRVVTGVSDRIEATFGASGTTGRPEGTIVAPEGTTVSPRGELLVPGEGKGRRTLVLPARRAVKFAGNGKHVLTWKGASECDTR